MGILGDLVVRLQADNKQFNGSIDKAQQRTQKFTKFMMGAAGFAGAILIMKRLGRAAMDLVRDFGVQEQAEAKMRAAIAATGREAEISAESIFEFAASLQRSTTWGDEATISAAALLQQLGNLNEEGIKQLLPGIQDMAAALGVSLETAASLVGKTLGSTTNALSRYGVVIDATAPKEQKVIELTEALTGMFGGLSEELAGTTTGTIEQVKNAFGDVREEMGELIAQLSENLLPLLLNAAELLQNVFGGIRAELKVRKLLDDPAEWRKATSNMTDARAAMEALTTHLENLEAAAEGKIKTRKFRETVADMKRRIDALSRAMMYMTEEPEGALPALQAGMEETEESTEDLSEDLENLEVTLEGVRDAAVGARDALVTGTIEASNASKSFISLLFEQEEQQQFMAEEAQRLQDERLAAIQEEMAQVQSQLDFEAEAWAAHYEELRQINEDQEKERVRQARESERQIAQIREAAFNTATQLIGLLAQSWDNYYTALLEDETLSDEERKQIQYNAAVKAQKFSIFEAVINTAQAITKALAAAAPPFNLILAALSAAAGAAQIAVIKRQPLPQLAGGGVVAELHPNEAIIPLDSSEAVSQMVAALNQAQGSPAAVGEQMFHVQVNVGPEKLYDIITKATRDRRILVDAGAVA